VPANDFCKIIVPCDPPFVALARRRRSPGVFSSSFFGRQRAILRGARIYFVTCILPRDWGVVLLDESNRAPALLSIPPLNFADLLLLPARSNIYARKCSDYTTIAHRRIIKSRLRVPAGRDILIDGGDTLIVAA